MKNCWLLIFVLMADTYSEIKSKASPLLLKELQEKVARSKLGNARVAISIYSLRHQRFEAAWNDTDWFTPASCLKLLVTAATIDTFPINYYPTTLLEVIGTKTGKTLRGKLKIQGGGDPNISDRFFPDALTPLLGWADSIKALGIDTLRGNIVVSDSFFMGPYRPEAWKRHHFNTWYGAEISALSFNDNCFALKVIPSKQAGAIPQIQVIPDLGYVRVVNIARTVPGKKNRIKFSQNGDSTIVTLSGSIGVDAAERAWILPVRNPILYFRAAMIRSLGLRQITFIEDSSSSFKSLATFSMTTAPLIAMVEETNQRSQNLHAELLLRHLGKRVMNDGSSNAGIHAEKEFLIRLGLDSADFDVHDGCGLSHSNRLKPKALTLLLARMARHRFGHEFVSTLATPGLDGATGRRLKAFTDEDLIRYKTGSISRVQALSGYLFALDGDTLAITAILNDFSGPSETAARLLDTIFTLASHWYNMERNSIVIGFKLLSRTDVPTRFQHRMRYFSQALLGLPYHLGPTGEGRFADVEPKPILDLERFDCVTFIESVLALSLSQKASDLISFLLPVRYFGDSIDYASRNHFFVGDWLLHNPKRFSFVRLVGDTLVKKTLLKKKLLASHGISTSKADPTVEYPLLPLEKAIQWASRNDMGDQFLGIAFATAIPGLDVTHTGFVDTKGGTPMLIHASEKQGKTASQNLKDYLISRRGKCTGIVLFEINIP